VHWISDVAAGAVLGLACLAGLRWLWYRRPAPTLALGELAALFTTALCASVVVAVLPRLAEAMDDFRLLQSLMP
jgi:membrane-associated phospholipid phosphatase